MSDTPFYYQVNGTMDVYDLERLVFGAPTLIDHMRMAAIEYLVRCPHKGTYYNDLEKVIVICNRLKEEGKHTNLT